MSAPRIGLIGAGRWAEVHRQALLAHGLAPAGVLVASTASQARVLTDWEVRATTDPGEFFAWEMDAVIVASPNYLHAEHAIAALEAGRHVLVEKPMATTLADCDAMIAAAERAGKVLAVGLEMRRFQLFEAVKAVLDAGEIGAPLHLKLDLWRRPHRSGAGGWKADPDKLGSAILEEPIHYLDLARWLLGEPAYVQAWANSRPGREYLFENLDVQLGFAGGGLALVTRSIAAYRHAVNLKLVGDKGALEARWEGEMDMDPTPKVSLVVHTARGTALRDVPQQTGHAYDVPRQTGAFIAAIRDGARPPADQYDGRAAVALCLAVEEALRQKQPISLSGD